ncbi:18.1 kDa class I heat shock protein [Physcomitrium patens]|uniref:SHSP domain-containing protein n=1 Tax=Physcomitrium patens TaxID=3218 RepID=A9SWK2_PHYPA|nr:18.1 kDa class I heat shock protein-like [Physcomitrium patens]PNR27807.1 hypothetical protein PHYPA_029959 [Physcomitrium patens]|eukprot:XP_024365060.1 18.1 kDa class I heat shock protein-like [Physcomitrella patens]
MALTPFWGRERGVGSWDSNPWDPFETTDALIDSIYNHPGLSLARSLQGVTSTSVDWKETATEHVIKADVPGLSKNEIKVEVDDTQRVLRINGERRKEEERQTDEWHVLERGDARYLRQLALPENANLDQITASVDNGVLTVTMPKLQAQQSKSRVRQIQVGDAGEEGPKQHRELIPVSALKKFFPFGHRK